MAFKRIITGLIAATVLAPVISWAASSAGSIPKIRIVGLFKDTAILSINDQQKMIRVGQKGPYGIQLVSASSDYAVFDVNGYRYTHGMSNQPFIQATQPQQSQEARIWQNNGSYQVPGTINNQLVTFLVDTGASYISMNRTQAKRLGIDYDSGRIININTANGQTKAHLVHLDNVKVGQIELSNVKAAIMENIASDSILLGMSFLQKVSMQNNGRVMLLQKRD